MIIPGALAALGYLVFVIALAVFMSLVCSMFGVIVRSPPQAQPLIASSNVTNPHCPPNDDANKNYNTNP